MTLLTLFSTRITTILNIMLANSTCRPITDSCTDIVLTMITNLMSCSFWCFSLLASIKKKSNVPRGVDGHGDEVIVPRRYAPLLVNVNPTWRWTPSSAHTFHVAHSACLTISVETSILRISQLSSPFPFSNALSEKAKLHIYSVPLTTLLFYCFYVLSMICYHWRN